jgi:hypothetical protein
MKTKLAFMLLLFCAAAQAQISGKLFYESSEPLQVGFVAGLRDASIHQQKSCATNVKLGDIHKKIISFIESDKDVLQFDAHIIVNGVLATWWPCPKKGQL